jgi:hypothetical protein
MAPESPQINYNTAEAKIKELTETTEPTPFKKSKPYCGCGQTYSCTSSLYLHIRSKHGGIPPPNTIGGPKGIVKKPNNYPTDPAVKLEEEANPNYNKFPQNKPNQSVTEQKTIPQVNSSSRNSTHKQSLDLNIKACKLCDKTYSCNSSLNLHLKRKHQIHRTLNGKT